MSIFKRLRPWIPEWVYGGIDGSITTFAIVAASSGADLGSGIILILGIANMLADGFSMSVGSFLSSTSETEEKKSPKDPKIRALMTFLSFCLFGSIPLSPYVYAFLKETPDQNTFLISCIATGITFVFIGILRTTVSNKNHLKNILETLLLGSSAASVAYFVGYLLDKFV